MGWNWSMKVKLDGVQHIYHCIQPDLECHKALQFLGWIDPRFDGIKREIIRGDQLFSVGVAYAVVRQEAARLHILGAATSDTVTSSDIGEGPIATDEGTWTSKRQTSPKVFDRDTVGQSQSKKEVVPQSKRTKENWYALTAEWWNTRRKPASNW